MAVDVDVDIVDNEEITNQGKMVFPLIINVFMAVVSYIVTVRVIPKLKEKFIKANLFGIDMSKSTSDKVPESLGVVSGFIFLVTMVLFIPVAFGNNLLEKGIFPYDEYVKYILALLSICCMLLLGFADDVLDVPWRQKLLLPTIASLPLLMVYYVSFNTTMIIVPKPFRDWLGTSVDIGIIYYVYMGMLAVFCTNAINILAGVNGLEAGQSVVIAISIALFNLVELSGPLWKAHQFSLYFMLPYIGTSFGLLKHNWLGLLYYVKEMCIYRPNRNKIILFSLILIQLCLIASYFFFYKPETKEKLNKIAFLPRVFAPDMPDRRTYYTLKDTVNLKRITSRGFFLDFNSSMCFTEGTDIKTMIVIKGINWKCNCLEGWHGPDCGYPEVLFRALLAKKQAAKLEGPGAFQRRLIYIFKYDKCSENLADIRLTTLGDIIDLFILYENDNHLESQLKNQYFKEWQHKILYIPNNTETESNIWKVAKAQIKNLRGDDYIISSPSNEIPDRASLIFLKFYKNVPEPIHFRLKWSVFGFFWTHPKKTLISGGACTIAYLRDILNNDLEALTNNKTVSNLSHKGMTLGDLNHTGGWFCEYCAAPEDIIEYLTSNSSKHLINWEKIGTTKITHKFIENLIEAGVYIDGKTELERGHRYSDIDFAPPYVLDNDFKFDFLLVNFYSQNEYYM